MRKLNYYYYYMFQFNLSGNCLLAIGSMDDVGILHLVDSLLSLVAMIKQPHSVLYCNLGYRGLSQVSFGTCKKISFTNLWVQKMQKLFPGGSICTVFYYRSLKLVEYATSS